MNEDPRLKDAHDADIVAIARKCGAVLKKHGAEFVGPCVKCGGTDRFGVNPAKGIFVCRGSGAGGDAIALVQHVKGLDFGEALEFITGRAGAKRAERAPARGEPPPGEPMPWDEDGADPNDQEEQAKPARDPEKEALWAPPSKIYPYVDEGGFEVYQKLRFEWIDNDGKKAKTFRQRRRPREGDDPKKIRDGWIWSLPGAGERVPYRLLGLQDAIAAGETIFVCYSPETEVLTKRGWVAFPSLVAADAVASWSMSDQSVQFVTPSALQRFAYSGPMVAIKSNAIDLLVTPDHRQVVDYTDGGVARHLRVVQAATVRWGHRIPTSGRYLGNGFVNLSRAFARLMVAWYADGSWEARGSQLNWNLKKTRKQERLRELLSACGIEWLEREYPSTPGWRSFVIKKDALRFLGFDWRPSADKRWPMASMEWPVEAREAALDELRRWDGDSTGLLGVRLFTGERETADAISAMAAVSGWYSAIRIDSRAGKNDSFVVNLAPKSRKTLSKTPKRVAYSGDVFCCTVDDGFLIVRRNGKVAVSGNCEGEKDADTVEAWGLAGTCTDMGAGTWPEEISRFFVGADVVILQDHDPQSVDRDGRLLFHPDGRPRVPGKDHTQAVGRALRSYAKSIRVLEFPEAGLKGDVTDWRDRCGGTAERLFDKIASEATVWAPERPGTKYGALTWEQLDDPGKEVEWLIRDFFTLGDRSVVGGESGSGKTFFALHAAMCIATGRDFFGRKVRQGLVIYQAGESPRGVKKRLRAWREHFGIDPKAKLPIIVLSKRIDLFREGVDVGPVIDEIKAWQAFYIDHPLRLAVIDTLAKAAVGADENSAKEMGVVLDNAQKIEEATGAHVMLLHHLNADGKRLRGSTAIYANLDQVIAVSEDEESKVRTAKVIKQKEDEGGAKIDFELLSVELGRDGDDKPITSCVILPVGEKAAVKEAKGKAFFIRDTERLAFSALLRALDEHGEPAPAGLPVPPTVRVVKVKAWFEAYMALAVHKSEDDRQRKSAAQKALARASNSFLQFGVVGRENPYAWWTGKAVRGFPRTEGSGGNVVPFAKPGSDGPMVDDGQPGITDLLDGP
jgi:hypothetical protein